MKIGYPCVNGGVGCTPDRRFRLASYSAERFRKTVASNLACLERILRANVNSGLFFFRIGSSLIPFASHPVCRVDWRRRFAAELATLGSFIKRNGIRISMHPDRFVVIGSADGTVHARSVAALRYHAALLDSMGLDDTAKIQIYMGGGYGAKAAAAARFMRRYASLPERVRARLVVENDDRNFSLADCLAVSKRSGIPVVFDVLHHELLNNGEPTPEALRRAAATWRRKDGAPMVDFSHQDLSKRLGARAGAINPSIFRFFLKNAAGQDPDVMVETKDGETGALKALALISTP